MGWAGWSGMGWAKPGLWANCRGFSLGWAVDWEFGLGWARVGVWAEIRGLGWVVGRGPWAGLVWAGLGQTWTVGCELRRGWTRLSRGAVLPGAGLV